MGHKSLLMNANKEVFFLGSCDAKSAQGLSLPQEEGWQCGLSFHGLKELCSCSRV
jgi:hypothetical protein